MNDRDKIIIAVKLDRVLYKRLKLIAEVQQVCFDTIIPSLLSDVFQLVDGFSTHDWNERLQPYPEDIE